MPNLASAKKNMRKSRAAAIRNRAQKSALRTALKRASAGGNAEEKLAAVKLLDRASRKRGNLVGLAPRCGKCCALFDETPLEPFGVARQRLPDQHPGNQSERDTAGNEPGRSLRRRP